MGRLVEKKGLDVLIDAFALLARRGVPFTATLIGDGEERGRIHDRVEAGGLGGPTGERSGDVCGGFGGGCY